MLVPEISLTPQTIQRFRGRCGEVAVLHSHLSDAERHGHWRRIAAGQVQVVVGARSAVFAPTRKLGLIVIDEEHENSFKQERRRATTPATWPSCGPGWKTSRSCSARPRRRWKAGTTPQRGQYTLLTLPSGSLDRPLPEVALIDLRHEPDRPAGRGAISPTLEQAHAAALQRRRPGHLAAQSPRVSHARPLPGVRPRRQVPICDLALTYHKPRRRAAVPLLRLRASRPPALSAVRPGRACATRGSAPRSLQTRDRGEVPRVRLSGGWTATPCAGPAATSGCSTPSARGDVHILLGTQMIAKGLDFPNVTLVGVVNADVGLHLPDFRAAERTFQLLAQVAGRAGRGPSGGRVLVQTFTPEHPVHRPGAASTTT